MHVFFDTGPLDHGTAFDGARSVIRADTAAEVSAAFDAMQRAQREGHWLAGFASYELGHVFSDKLSDLMPADRRVPLLQFGVFDRPEPKSGMIAPKAPVALDDITPVWNSQTYARAFAKARNYIGAGDIYQVNLTFPMSARATGTAQDLYATLRAHQPVGQGAFLDLGDATILSRSPELFFDVTTEGVITTRPMKGTAPRGATMAEDIANAQGLAASVKNRAENLMIVDLLRNDISRVAQVGSVRVPRLYDVETYTTVHQMVSDVTAQLRPDATLYQIFEALFPCGSITGAPKIRAMQIIAELEARARGAYCGAIGWIAPDGRMRFNVAIRTLTLWPGGEVRFDVGGGVVWDSTADGEYEEALWKARFATLAPTT